ncbi:RidA family protein [uncultured Roseibium sp.]|uniref:RidA family protein n=1 Tax=uncultured Roseibium sp. TaxID=1936171 RepID=UPI002633602B|nr:RidA family protein [uncultured Roseibium sp.]
MIQEHIQTDKAPVPFGHYAQATKYGGVIYVSGQLAAKVDGTHRCAEPFEDQVQQALQNLIAIVEAGGGDKHTILKVTAYVVGVHHWPTFNTIYAETFGKAQPARAVVPVPALHHGYLIELDAIAAVL